MTTEKNWANWPLNNKIARKIRFYCFLRLEKMCVKCERNIFELFAKKNQKMVSCCHGLNLRWHLQLGDCWSAAFIWIRVENPLEKLSRIYFQSENTKILSHLFQSTAKQTGQKILSCALNLCHTICESRHIIAINFVRFLISCVSFCVCGLCAPIFFFSIKRHIKMIWCYLRDKWMILNFTSTVAIIHIEIQCACGVLGWSFFRCFDCCCNHRKQSERFLALLCPLRFFWVFSCGSRESWRIPYREMDTHNSIRNEYVRS